MATLRHWSVTLVAAAITAAVLLVAGFLIAGTGSGDSKHPAKGSLPEIVREAQQAAREAPELPRLVGPEGVPLVRAAPLGPASSPAKGKSRAGIPCGSTEQLGFHVHARLTLFVNGKPRAVPLGVGIGKPVDVTDSGAGAFASGGSCFSFLHTHAADGIIHIEAPAPVTFRLGQFFAVWQQRLDRTHLGSARGRVLAWVNGRPWSGDPRAIPLHKHGQIQLEVGRPAVPPARINFPPGL